MVIGIAHLQPIIAIIAGILILVIPRLLNIIVAVYLIIAGLLGLGLFREPKFRLAPACSEVFLRAIVPIDSY